jgi:hypothetical protein
VFRRLLVFLLHPIPSSPSYVLKIKEHCNEHQEKFNLYCKEHECPCCRICIVKNHSDCKNVAIMEEIIKNVKTSIMFNMGIVVWPRDSFHELWYSMHSVQSPSSQSRNQPSDGLEIWRLSHILQKDGEVDMMLISCNILNIRKSLIYTVKNMSVRVVEFASWKITVIVRM